MANSTSEIAILSGTSHPELAKQIARHLGLSLCSRQIAHFPDGETSVTVEESVRGKDTFVVQSIVLNPNHYLMELFIIIDALRRASARSITAVIPYFGYARQDRKDKPRVPITAKLVANMLVQAGVHHVLTMDLHAPQLQGFFDVPVDDLPGISVLLPELANLNRSTLAVVAPDIGSVKAARKYATALDCDFVVIDKQRQTPGEQPSMQLIGNVAGKDVLLADDMCTTGSTLASAAKACHGKGARRIFAAVTHGVFVGDAVAAIEQCPLEWVLTTDSIPTTPRLNGTTKIRAASSALLFGEAIRCCTTHESISSLSQSLHF